MIGFLLWVCNDSIASHGLRIFNWLMMNFWEEKIGWIIFQIHLSKGVVIYLFIYRGMIDM